MDEQRLAAFDAKIVEMSSGVAGTTGGALEPRDVGHGALTYSQMMPFAAGNGVWRLAGAMLLIIVVTLVLDWRARR